jgi:yecA family protein
MLEFDRQLDSAELNDLAQKLGAMTDGRAMDLILLEGFCASLVVGPRPVTTSHWLPWVWDCEKGRAEPHIRSLDEANEVLALLMRFYNSVASALGDETIDAFEPMYAGDDLGGPLAWCAGFHIGMGFDNAEWNRLMQTEPTWFVPFFLPGMRLETRQTFTENDLALFEESLPQSLRQLRDHWREQQLPPLGGSFANPFAHRDSPSPVAPARGSAGRISALAAAARSTRSVAA